MFLIFIAFYDFLYFLSSPMLSSDRPHRVHQVSRHFGHSLEAIGVSSALHSSSQPSPLFDSNATISSLPFTPVPPPPQLKNISSSQFFLPNLFYLFTYCSCKLHKRLASVKYRNCSSFFNLRCVKLSRVQALSLEAIGSVTNAQVSSILWSLSNLILISPTRHLLNICKT